jgi:hypothetical protein
MVPLGSSNPLIASSVFHPFASLVDFLAAGSGWDEQMMVFE